MRVLRAAGRLLAALAHACAGWWTITLTFPGLAQAQRDIRVQVWAAQMLNLLGIRLVVRGTPPVCGPVLLVANHISWLDILVMHAARHCRFVSKAELRHWPLLGTLATGAGTLYIERESRRDAMRVVHRMAEALRDGDVLAVFPEGTTSDGTGMLPFHANLLQAALSASAPVQPVALDFMDAATGARSFAARYIDDDSLVGSLWRTLTAPPLEVRVHWGEPEAANGRGRRAWAADLRERVAALREAG